MGLSLQLRFLFKKGAERKGKQHQLAHSHKDNNQEKLKKGERQGTTSKNVTILKLLQLAGEFFSHFYQVLARRRFATSALETFPRAESVPGINVEGF